MGMLALGLAGVWLAAALMLGYVPPVRRPAVAWGLAVLGIPVLGFLTYIWGPGLGVMGFAIGLMILRWSAVLTASRKPVTRYGLRRSSYRKMS